MQSCNCFVSAFNKKCAQAAWWWDSRFTYLRLWSWFLRLLEICGLLAVRFLVLWWKSYVVECKCAGLRLEILCERTPRLDWLANDKKRTNCSCWPTDLSRISSKFFTAMFDLCRIKIKCSIKYLSFSLSGWLVACLCSCLQDYLVHGH
jgi:hypothetical protein